MSDTSADWHVGVPNFLSACSDIGVDLEATSDDAAPIDIGVCVAYAGQKPLWISEKAAPDHPWFSFRLIHGTSVTVHEAPVRSRWTVDLVAAPALANISSANRAESLTIEGPASDFDQVAHAICQFFVRQGYIGTETEQIFDAAAGRAGRAFFSPLTGEDAVIEFDSQKTGAWPQSESPCFLVAQFEAQEEQSGLQNVTLIAAILNERAPQAEIIVKFFDACELTGTLVVMFD